MIGKDCSKEDVERALEALATDPLRIRARDWPVGLQGLDEAGLYSWCIDEEGANQLGQGLGLPVTPGRIYAGQTGATRWPSGTPSSNTLSGRIGSLHLRGKVRGSTFRLTLAASLLDPLGLEVAESKKLALDSERVLTTWMADHLEVACFPYADRDALDDLETRILQHIDPPLNLAKMTATPTRMRLTELRSRIVNPHRGGEERV